MGRKERALQGGGASLLIFGFPAVLKAAGKSRRDSRLKGMGMVSLGKHEGGRISPSVPRDSVCPCEPDPAQGHCPRAPGRVGGLPRTPDHRKPLNLGWSKKRTCRGGRTLSGLGGPTSYYSLLHRGQPAGSHPPPCFVAAGRVDPISPAPFGSMTNSLAPTSDLKRMWTS